MDILESQEIRIYYDRKWYPESLYLLAMLDYISRENDIPLCEEYDDLRCCKLEKPVYPSSILAVFAASKDDSVLVNASMTAIPEFKRFNIIENEVRNVNEKIYEFKRKTLTHTLSEIPLIGCHLFS